jgi:hypothetical protein
LANLEQQMDQQLVYGNMDDALDTYKQIQKAFPKATISVQKKHFSDIKELNDRLAKKM